jgi:hypothetical protein
VKDTLNLPDLLDLDTAEKHPIVRTAKEQAADPYLLHIMMVCYFNPPKECAAVAPGDEGTKDGGRRICRSHWKKTYDEQLLFPCTVTSCVSVGGKDWYTVSMLAGASQPEEVNGRTHVVEYVPRAALAFVDRPYSRDQYAWGAFCREVELPDGMMPLHWMDLILSDTQQ